MPPKPKFTREEIIEAALKIAANKGMKAVTSRELGATLGSSARPIFTAFKNMDEVLDEVRKAAFERFYEYTNSAVDFTPMFKQVGLQMIRFADEQPKLYRLLFMSENAEARSFDDVFVSLGELGVQCVEAIMRDYDMSRADAMLLFSHSWVYTYGIGSLIASGTCRFEQQQIQDMLSQNFVATLTLIKSGRVNNCITIPQKNDDNTKGK